MFSCFGLKPPFFFFLFSVAFYLCSGIILSHFAFGISLVTCSFFSWREEFDCMDECDTALCNLKGGLLNCVILAHPGFSEPLILSIDASLDGWEQYCQNTHWGRKSMYRHFQ